MSALATFKRTHGVVTYRYSIRARTGNGMQYPVCAYFATIKMKNGTMRGFAELAHEFSWDALRRRNKWAEGADELSACKLLAERNGIPWPADEPKKRKSKQ
jgi:hypothetical protein